jgi:uncharacterized membrane protein
MSSPWRSNFTEPSTQSHIVKTHILNQTIAALLFAIPIAQADDQKAVEKKEPSKSGKSSASTSVTTSSDGTATITIDVNGKKETRTFELGKGSNTFTFGKDGDGAKATGSIAIGGNVHPMPGHVKREKGPWLGIAMEPVQEVVRAQLPLAPGEGIVVSHVVPDGPAAKAGLQPNDILLRFEDQILVEPSQLQKLIAMKKPGDSVKLGFMRKGERKEADVTLVEHEIESGGSNPMQWLQGMPGMQMDNRLEHLQDQLRQLKDKHPGVIIDKRSWLSGAPEEILKGQIEKLRRGLEESKLPKEQIENLRKELEHAKHEAQEAMERAKNSSEEAMERARRALEEASKAINNARKPHQKIDDNPKKPGEPL